MKYITFKVEEDGVDRRVPVIFPNELVHKIVARAMVDCLRRHGMRAEVASAGSVTLGSGTKVGGESETLGVKSREEDALLISMNDYAHGIADPELERIYLELSAFAKKARGE